jgi:tellurium resistance protein TerD
MSIIRRKDMGESEDDWETFDPTKTYSNSQMDDAREGHTEAFPNKDGYYPYWDPNVRYPNRNDNPPLIQKTKDQIAEAQNQLQCPRCRSTQIVIGSRGFSGGTGLLGAVLFGPIGALGGFLGSNKTICRCGKCGHSWSVE